MTDTTMNQFKRIEAATDYVAERLVATLRAADSVHLVDVNKDVAEPSRYINATPSLGPVVRELVLGKRKTERGRECGPGGRQTGRGPGEGLAGDRLDHAQGENQERKETLWARISGWKQKRLRCIASAWARISTCIWPNSARPTGQALEEEEKQVREQATADGKANVQQEIQLLIDRATAADSRAGKATTRAKNAESALEKLKERCKVFLDALESLPEKMHNYFTSLMGSAAEVTRDHFAKQATPQIPVRQKTQDPQGHSR